MSFNPNAQRDAKINEWIIAQKELDKAKEVEAALRADVVALLFPTNAVLGTHSYDLGDGYKIKAVIKENIKLLPVKNEAGEIIYDVHNALEEIEKIGPEGELLADRLVKFKPELSLTEYKKLPEFAKKIIDKVITTSPATPSLEFVPPKSK